MYFKKASLFQILTIRPQSAGMGGRSLGNSAKLGSVIGCKTTGPVAGGMFSSAQTVAAGGRSGAGLGGKSVAAGAESAAMGGPGNAALFK